MGLGGPFNPFLLNPAGWLDAAYMSYAWPDYFRPAPPPPQPTSVPPLQPAKVTSLDGLYSSVAGFHPATFLRAPLHSHHLGPLGAPPPPPHSGTQPERDTDTDEEDIDVVRSAFRPLSGGAAPATITEPDSTVQEPPVTPPPPPAPKCDLKAPKKQILASPPTKLHPTQSHKAQVWRPY